MKYVAGYSEINAGAYNIPVHTIYEYAEVAKERDAYNEANDALTIQLAAIEAKASRLREAVEQTLVYLNVLIDFDALMRGKIDERHFIQRQKMTKTEFLRRDSRNDDVRLAHICRDALADYSEAGTCPGCVDGVITIQGIPGPVTYKPCPIHGSKEA